MTAVVTGSLKGGKEGLGVEGGGARSTLNILKGLLGQDKRGEKDNTRFLEDV